MLHLLFYVCTHRNAQVYTHCVMHKVCTHCVVHKCVHILCQYTSMHTLCNTQYTSVYIFCVNAQPVQHKLY